ncbi:hypothetical protein HELRODRAFT_78945 [Helobdella robusta]|uniref:RIIa domain-containing protein n=1 Tax=Helobdella robusta TaxID=6412 RepID=T1G3H5_HELRO|nr:hypothetical protein HELRODRAFT_78945 [Helobdella robusta]ESO04738.1 hypothetical protein HELRODRAFT_78945 [Helobdella robusta]
MSYAPTKLKVPRGFHSLLEKFCIEVLRTQPDDIHTFGAFYFADLLEKREGVYVCVFVCV